MSALNVDKHPRLAIWKREVLAW